MYGDYLTRVATEYSCSSGSRRKGEVVRSSREIRFRRHILNLFLTPESVIPYEPPSSFLDILLVCNIHLTSVQQHIDILEPIQK